MYSYQCLLAGLKCGSIIGMVSSGSIDCGCQGPLWKVWWGAWAWMLLLALVSWLQDSWYFRLNLECASCIFHDPELFAIFTCSFQCFLKFHCYVDFFQCPPFWFFLSWIWFIILPQDNVFVNVVASVQYRALADKAADAFYKLSNTKGQIQSYVFDGKLNVSNYSSN